jgi:hypothetical protein
MELPTVSPQGPNGFEGLRGPGGGALTLENVGTRNFWPFLRVFAARKGRANPRKCWDAEFLADFGRFRPKSANNEAAQGAKKPR